MNRTLIKPSAKDVSSRIAERRLEHAAIWGSGKFLYYASWIILLTMSIIFSAVIFNWAAGIKPPPVQTSIGVSMTRLNQNQIEVMIISLEKDAQLKHLTYRTPHGSGIINKSEAPFEPVRDVGDSGIIQVSGYYDKLEIHAVLANDKKISIYKKLY